MNQRARTHRLLLPRHANLSMLPDLNSHTAHVTACSFSVMYVKSSLRIGNGSTTLSINMPAHDIGR